MRRLSNEDGNVVVIVALTMTTLFGFLALVVDAGAMYVKRSQLQSGADAAALAIAKQCADAVVYGTTTCSTSAAQGYFDDNVVDGATVAVSAPVLQTSHAGKVGRITVTGALTHQPYFAGVIGEGGPATVRATATARWGPLTAVDNVLPIAVCKGALPPAGQSVELVVSPDTPTPPATCDGAVDEQPFGWISPDDPALCESKITLLPSIYLTVQPASAFPTNPGCATALQELRYDIDKTAVCHSTPKKGWHCHGAATDADRQRTVVVYDAAAGGNPSYSLVRLEFTAIRLGSDTATASASTLPQFCEDPDPVPVPPEPVGTRQCFRAIVQNALPPIDGPIFDPTLAALPGIDDTTVLDVRLVD